MGKERIKTGGLSGLPQDTKEKKNFEGEIGKNAVKHLLGKRRTLKDTSKNTNLFVQSCLA